MGTKLFQKAKSEQAYFKAALYGKAGTGKTLTSLLWAEGLAARDKKRVAYIDTERGTEFYAMDIAQRKVHPKAFDFDRLITRSIMETVEAVESIDPAEHSVVVIDSITHLWEAARAAYTGKLMSNGRYSDSSMAGH
jgi:KaiC/GvpD/RAD55 family RecA-like ATPase